MPYVYYPFTKKDKSGKNVWELRSGKCLGCGDPFITRNPEKQYCSKPCKHRETVRRSRNDKKKSNNSSSV
jgi:hypothetical protein